ncbi:TPA: Uma2 family endonuclease [Candidatus Poribacteria bacterium]|nr:Uma2 family endonuclease [Candidatus Poribacteria bacterium]
MNQTAFTKTKKFLRGKVDVSYRDFQFLKYLPVRRFSVSEYHKMGEEGILSEDEHIELIEGVILQMSTEGTKHSAIITKIAMRFYESVIEGKALLRIQNPVVLNDDTEPEPDLALVKPRVDVYAEEHPHPDDVLLLIEVTDTSLEYDKEIKLPRYAASKIEEVWIVNLVDDVIAVYQKPFVLADGTAGYRIRTNFVRGDTLNPQAIPSLKIRVDDVLV